MNDKLKVLLHAVAEVTNIDTATLRQQIQDTQDSFCQTCVLLCWMYQAEIQTTGYRELYRIITKQGVPGYLTEQLHESEQSGVQGHL